MQDTFTQNQLIKTLYQESDPTLSRKLFAALSDDISLKEQFNLLNNIIIELDNAGSYMPSKTSLDIIKEYSLKTRK